MLNKKQLLTAILKHTLKTGGIIIIAIILIVFAGKQIIKIANSLQEKMVLSSVLEKRNETSLKLREDFKLVGEKNKKIEAALPSADNILEFVGILESLAKGRSLNQTVKFNSPAPLAAVINDLKLSSIDYSIVLDGNISTLIDYLKDFEKLPYFSGISSITVNATPPEGWGGKSSIFIQAKLYVKDISSN